MHKRDKIPSIGIVGDALAPNFNEAMANLMALLAREIDAPVLTCNNLHWKLFQRTGRYLIVNGRFFREGTNVPVLSVMNGALFLLFLKSFERRFDTVILSGGIDSGFFNHVHLEKCILFINSAPYEVDEKEMVDFARNIAPRLKGIVAQSRQIRLRFIEAGVDPEKIEVVYPWVDLQRFTVTEPSPVQPFKVVFASAPNTANRGESIFRDKGIPLLLESFKDFATRHEASLTILWRGFDSDLLSREIRRLALENKVTVIDEITDMVQILSESHVTVIPFTNLRRSPEIPLSAVESLASGRPVVTTDVPEIAEIIRDYRCGCIASPNRKSLEEALDDCLKNYREYQQYCRKTAEELFGIGGQVKRSISMIEIGDHAD